MCGLMQSIDMIVMGAAEQLHRSVMERAVCTHQMQRLL